MRARDFGRAAQRPWWLAVLLAMFMALLSACSDSPEAAPTISVQPSDTSAVAGSAATLSVTAAGPDIAYQWQVSTDGGTTWTNVAGATQASYTTPPTTPADNGKRYRVVVSAAGISVNSSAVQLTVTAAVVAPTLTVQPAAQTATAPDPATFSITASGTSPSFQWQRSTDNGATFVTITGATSASYGTGATDVAMNGHQFRVVVSNGAGSVTSSAAVLTVNPAPAAAAFTTQPANQSVTAGSAAAFTVAATGTPTPTLQWQRSTDGGSTFANIAGATDPTYNTGTTTLSQNGERYRAVATNSAGSATSNVATLAVNPAPQAPAITTQPTPQTVTAPAPATFTAAATGVPTPTWQWQLSTDGGSTFANITGATSASYTTPATTTADTGKRYRAIASNSVGSVQTTTVGLAVNPAASTVTPFLGRWPTPSMVEAVNNTVGGLIREVQLACGRDGSCLAVWARISSNDPANDGVYAARYTTAAGWGAASPLALDRGREPKVGMDDLGNAVVVWSARDGGNVLQAFVRRFSPTSGWSGAAQLSPAGTDRATAPMAVAMNGNGQVVVAYLRRLAVEGADSLWAARPVGSGWESVRVPVAASANDLSARLDGLGRATLLWRGGGNAVWAASGAADGSWTSAVDLSGARASSRAPRLAIDADGQAFAVWNQYIGSDTTLNLRRRPGGGVWQAVQVQTFAPSVAVEGVDIAAGPTGAATVVYAVGAGSIATRDFTAAGGWNPNHSVLVEGAVIASDQPRIVMDAGGNLTALWRGIDTSGNGAIYTRSFAAGLGWSPLLTASPTQLATYEQTYRETALAPLGDGRSAMLFLRTNTSFQDELLGAVQTP